MLLEQDALLQQDDEELGLLEDRLELSIKSKSHVSFVIRIKI